MTIRRGFGAVVLAVALVAGACGNSGDDGGEDEASGGDGDGSGLTTEAEIYADADRDASMPVDASGVSDSEIAFSSITTISSNPLGTNIGPAYNAGITAYFDWRNGEGGIYGRDLVLANERDDELFFNDREAQAVVSEDDVFGAFVATLGFTGADILNDAGVPTFGWNINSFFGDRENIFGQIAPSCAECFGRILPYLAREEGASRIGILGYGESEESKTCANTQRDTFDQFTDDAGVEVAFFEDSLAFGLPNGIAPEVTAMLDAEVDFITACIDLNGMQGLADEARKQGLDATLYHPNTYNAEFVAQNAEIFEGDIVSPGFLAFENEVDSEVRDAYFENIPDDVRNEELAMVGWLNAHLAFTGLLAAGPEFDQASTVASIRSIEDYTADGQSNSIDWNRQIPIPTNETPEDDYEQECWNGVRVVDGEFVPYSDDPSTPWLCWEMPRDVWGEPTPTSFAE